MPYCMTVEAVKNLIEEAEEKLIEHDYVGSVEFYQKTFQNRSAHAAGKLGVIYHGGLNRTISADHITASAYYFLALKLINTIPSNRWDMNLLLEVIGGISEIYRFQMDRSKEFDIWQTGVKAMRRIDQTLQDPIFCLYQKQQQSHVHSYLSTTKDDYENKIKAIHIDINYCLGLMYECDKNHTNALKFFKICKNIQKCGFPTADKLIKKSQEKIQSIDLQIPKSNRFVSSVILKQPN
ncbi:12166_t:CDS:2 [Entrophospora sp. SA101]|nr:5354_t:CDS:2 [Entrophospora sp. SA101]CAJ0755221.1 12166_t:CDS:2 [Entrophospora sp. SA101]CAJ0858118.1 1774_t:CDS:2 [Entrophospora sp. SA101]